MSREQVASRSLAPGLVGAWHRFALFPMHTITARTGIAQALHRARTRMAHQWIERRGFSALLSGQQEGALGQDAADLRYLYETVKKRRPKRLVEFGSGQSTIFIAQALHDTGEGHLWSLDACEPWLDHTASILPEYLRPYVTLVHSPVEVDNSFEAPAWRYTRVPEGSWDFVMMDGPELTPAVGMTSNLIDLPLNSGATGFIDHRWRTANLTAENAGHLRLRYMPSLESFEMRA